MIIRSLGDDCLILTLCNGIIRKKIHKDISENINSINNNFDNLLDISQMMTRKRCGRKIKFYGKVLVSKCDEPYR